MSSVSVLLQGPSVSTVMPHAWGCAQQPKTMQHRYFAPVPVASMPRFPARNLLISSANDLAAMLQTSVLWDVQTTNSSRTDVYQQQQILHAPGSPGHHMLQKTAYSLLQSARSANTTCMWCLATNAIFSESIFTRQRAGLLAWHVSNR